jgi:aspartyl-tRNA(Asn)/glutamyl-tRNA(Gln) amidotransferase subunit B
MHNLKPTIGKEEIMHNLKPTIGIEVHTILNTKSKMFSPSSNIRNSVPNSTINEIDLALPGTMPSPNKEAVIKAIKLALALEMEIDTNLLFDRKHYFYQDLPKGFQITQQYFPIGKNGKIKISNKVINIERIHIEEDTAKQLIIENQLCLDYNRCGAPLVEIVTKPEFESEIEVVEYLNELKRILIFLNISDGKMEDGSLRCDVNISVSQKDSKTLGSKVEIKNINSFKNVADAIKYEIKRQSNLISTNKLVEQETRR